MTPQEQAADLVRQCELADGAIVVRDGAVIVLSDKLPDHKQSVVCIFRNTLRKPNEDRVVFADNETRIEAALKAKKEIAEQIAEEGRLRPQRIAKVERVLDAIKRNDVTALGREGVLGKPYIVAGDRWKNTPPTNAVFNLKSLSAFGQCTPQRPWSGNVASLTVQWDCPEGTVLPWVSTATSFHFKDVDIVEIRTEPGLPLVSARQSPSRTIPATTPAN